MTTVTRQGFKELEKALGLLVEATGKTTQAKAAIRRTLTEAGKITQEAAQANAPKLTGALEVSIAVGTKLTKRQARMARKAGKDDVEVYVGTADPAGIAQEFGNFSNNAQPFLGPAWDSTQNEVLDKIATESWAQVEKAAQRIGRKR
jgi:HK97 gp10 family phage protein